MSRIEEQGIRKRFQVTKEGFVIGFVEANTKAEAEVLMQKDYGVDCKLGHVFDLNRPTEFLEDELGNRTFRIGASYKAEFVPIVCQKPHTVNQDGHQVVVGMQEETAGGVGEVLDKWFLHHPGIHVIHMSNTKDPNTGWIGFLIVYYQMIELPTVPTLDELSGDVKLLEEQLRQQRDFLIRCATDLQSNDALFEYARNLGVEWNPAKHPITERGNCIQAVRRFHNWI